MVKKQFLKIQFYDPDIGYENLWAAALPNKRYRIESIPFFIYGVALHDTVTATPDSDGFLQFRKVVKSSGNRTLRARSADLGKQSRFRKKLIEDLEALGTEVEVFRSRLFGINVPKALDIHTLENYLTHDAKVSWEYGKPEKSGRP